MRLFIICFCLFLVSFSVCAQFVQNTPLKNELDRMFVLDQKYRAIMSMDMRVKGDSLASLFRVEKENLAGYLWKLQSGIDSSNLIRVEKIIETYGYPGKSLVGVPSNEAAFFVIQHSGVIDKYLALIKQAAERNELPFPLYAMMLDRSLMNQGKEQVYGTQAMGFRVEDTKTGKKEMKMIIWPIKDAAFVNQRRKEAGFEQTVEENAKRLGVEYKVLTLADIEKIKGR
jgi:hypothetical protein